MGEDLRDVVFGVGEWGSRWLLAEGGQGDINPQAVMWWIHKRLDPTPLPDRRVVMRVDLEQDPQPFWLVFEGVKPSVCYIDPGYQVDVYIGTDKLTLFDLWQGTQTLSGAIKTGTARPDGPSAASDTRTGATIQERGPRTIGVMRRLLTLLAAVLLLGMACGGNGDESSTASSDDGGSEEVDASGIGGATIVTVGELGLDLPIVVPDEIPAPSSGVYVGEIEGDDPYTSVHIGSDYDASELRAALRDWAAAAGANFDDSLEQALLVTSNPDGTTTAVYAWVRTTDQGDYPTLLEIGTVTQEQ